MWSVNGALSQVTSLPITTLVTCPTVRMHPAVNAQVAATAAVLTGGGFRFGPGSGEALNEYVLGGTWPAADERLDMLEEAVEVIRKLFTGRQITHRGPHHTVRTPASTRFPRSPYRFYRTEILPRLTGGATPARTTTAPS